MGNSFFYRHKGLIVGGFIGLFFGPIGLIIGLLIGYSIDQGRPMASGRATNEAFFEACFLVMGYVAKADGRVSEKEVAYARYVMQQLHLNESQTQTAMRLFYRGKNNDFDRQAVLNKLRLNAGNRPRILAQFINIQVKLAYINGAIDPQMKQVLQSLAAEIGLGRLNFAYYDLMFGWQNNFEQASQFGFKQQQGYHQQQQQFRPRSNYAGSLNDAYRLLGVNAQSSKTDVKRAYRRMMSKYHPDKLMSKGLSDEEMRQATEKAQKIKSAYEQICEAKGFHH